MDNFMDKLAEKYNAQDMIRANSQAESAQMQNLQEQVEAYEAVLQEMRKLNYKNTELTEKMYALVDESIEKVRTLQIEAEGGANTELVSREMSDAVNRAMSEAVSNLDDAVVRSLTQTLENAIAQPADQLRQSTEDVRNSVVAVQSSADDMRNGVVDVKSSVDRLGTGIESVKSSVDQMEAGFGGIKSSVEDMTAGMELVTSGMENVKVSVDQMNNGLGSIREEIGSVKDEFGSIKDEIGSVKDGFGSIKDEVGSIKDEFGSIKDEVGSVKDEFDSVQDKLFAIQQTGSNTEETLSTVAAAVRELSQKEAPAGVSPEMMDEIRRISDQLKEMQENTLSGLSEQLERMQKDTIDGISDKMEGMKSLPSEEPKADNEALDKIGASLEELKQQAQISSLIQETLSALAQSNSKTQDSLTELMTAVANLKESNKTSLETVKTMAGTGEAAKNGIAELKTANDENRSALEDIFHVLQSTKSDVAELKAGIASRPDERETGEELVKALSDLMANNTEVSANIRNLKQATDENRNTIKSTIDSSIYGLKQDNKEIVEFLQRMNSNIIKKAEDDEKAAKKEEEDAAKAEEERKMLEERFKAAEDFMHKESVKVYRNVQAVINEKNDKQKESVESANLSVEKRVGKVKALVVINMVFTLINLATMILYIFGFLGAH